MHGWFQGTIPIRIRTYIPIMPEQIKLMRRHKGSIETGRLIIWTLCVRLIPSFSDKPLAYFKHFHIFPPESHLPSNKQPILWSQGGVNSLPIAPWVSAPMILRIQSIGWMYGDVAVCSSHRKIYWHPIIICWYLSHIDPKYYNWYINPYGSNDFQLLTIS